MSENATKSTTGVAEKAHEDMLEEASSNIAGSVMGAVAGLAGMGPVVAEEVHEQVTGAIEETRRKSQKK
jgi:hypothetical protein